MMDKTMIEQYIRDFLDNDPSNFISAQIARHPEYAGIRFFDAPLIGYAAADDGYLCSLAKNEAAGIDLKQPEDWLPDARTVLSWFLPFTEEIRKSNREDGRPSDLWQQARVNGQECLVKLACAAASFLKNNGHPSIAPIGDGRMEVFSDFDHAEDTKFTSNWSERHIAYAAGLGTFSLNRGLITKKGMAGRYASVITTLALKPTPWPYSTLTAYCNLCGACVRRCPAGAISVSGGKDHNVCAVYLRTVTEPGGAYYGCGKCQCEVPCETSAPGIEGDLS